MWVKTQNMQNIRHKYCACVTDRSLNQEEICKISCSLSGNVLLRLTFNNLINLISYCNFSIPSAFFPHIPKEHTSVSSLKTPRRALFTFEMRIFCLFFRISLLFC